MKFMILGKATKVLGDSPALEGFRKLGVGE